MKTPPEKLWRSNPLLDFALSPDGRFLALHQKSGKQAWVIDVIDLISGQRHRVARSELAYVSVAWSGVNRLLLEVGPYGERIIDLVRVNAEHAETLRFESVRLPRRGLLIDALPGEPDQILFGSYTRRNELMVHRVDLSSQESADAFRSVFRDRLNAGVQNDLTWMADGQGRLRVALLTKDGKRVLVHGADGHFEPLTELDDEVDFEPYSLSFDGNLIYGLSDHDRGQRDLVAYDVAARKMGETLFSREGVDVQRPLFDHRGEPIGVTYYQGGQRFSEFFGEDDRRQENALRQAFVGKQVATAARSIDGSQRLLWIDAPDQPPQLFHFDAKERRASPVLQAMPWLDGIEFVPSQVIAVKAADGTELDAFLTLPASDSKRPLIVLPHGGPIGIADDRHFDREVQFLAGLGYAVLQINFRGSDGYGRAFRDAGKGNFGRLIEDDIDAALQQVLATQPIDRNRMCIVGASYGGYSALISAVRWPERFRCAVSINGLSDLPLHMTASDSMGSAKSRERMQQIIGDPGRDLESMQAASPLYQHERLQTPVLLVHGLRDRRVDAEQTRRLLRLMQANGHSPAVLWFEEKGHALAGVKTQRTLWRSVAGFLAQHLSGATETRSRDVQ